MERAISEMEKIRKAEEIYSKRKNLKSASATKEKTKSVYKYLFQILVLFNVALVIVAVQNREYIFSNEFLEKINSYNINLKEKFSEIFEKEEDKVEKEENQIQEDAVGGSTEADTTKEAIVENEAAQLSQMEQDAKEINETYSVILPISGTKTSGFGERESTNSIVTKNHTGIDIANVTGTVIKSAHNGTVTQVSSTGDYGKHLKITDGSLTTLYAHCSKIYVSEGQVVSQGENIAEVRKYWKFNRSALTF